MSGASTSSTPAAPTYAVQDLVGLALRQLGVGAQGTTPAAADLADGLMHLNMMLAQWQRRRWMVPALVEIVAEATGMVDMFVGPGADFDVPNRPDRIDAAFARYLGAGASPADFASPDFSPDFLINGLDNPGLALDFPLQIIASREDYSAIALKNLRTWPAAAFYSPEWPNGRLNVWPIPAAGLWEIHIVAKTMLPTGLQLATQIALPPEYLDAIMWSLAARMAPSYGQEASPTVAAMARASLQTIKAANTQMPRLRMPASVGRPRAGAWPSIMTGWF